MRRTRSFFCSMLPGVELRSFVLKLIFPFSFFFFKKKSLDPEQKDQLIEVIEKLLADKTTVGP